MDEPFAVQNTGSNKDFGVTQDSRLYFDLSSPGRFFNDPESTPLSFNNPRRNKDIVTKQD